VYNSETLSVEESMHFKFDDKEPGSETPEQDESCVDIQVIEDTPELDQTSDSEVSPEVEPISEVEPTSEAQEEVASDEAQNGYQQANQSKIRSSISLHILRIKSLETKIVLEEQDHTSYKKSL